MAKSIGMLGVAIAITGTAIFAAAAVQIAGPPLETRAFPVVKDVRFSVVGRANNRMAIDWYGRKVRDCEIISTTALVRWYGTMYAAALSASDDPGDAPLPLVKRPAAPDLEQKFRRMDVIPEGDAILIEMRHRCHALWPTVTRVPLTELP